ncbi:Kelch repeat-containing protein [Pseudomonas yamanorum]|uniref:Kelch repeat-containing protein n=1 Tax=Pseudomonas yamanorum TaxID=515393 RepID=UPI0009C10753|nr:kelch repeat-containing protein [Pseudomonas yamanorum]
MASLMTGVFTPTGSMLEPRYFLNAVGIGDLAVLVIAGEGPGEASGPRFDQLAPGAPGCASTTRIMASVEFYHQASGQWSTVAPLPFPRSASAAVVLQSGIVLLTAGSESGQSISDVQLYNVSTNRWTPARPLHTPRYGHTSTLLASGNVLVVGGNNLQSGGGQVQDSVECYDPLTGHWQRKAWLPVDAMNHTATLPASFMIRGPLNGR